MRLKLVYLLTVLPFLLAFGVASVIAQQQAAPPPSKFQLTTPAFAEGAKIPAQYSCTDPNAGSPPLHWSNAPDGTASLAMILHDTDAAPAKGAMDVTHWIFWNIPASSSQVMGSIKADATPDGIQQGKNVRGVNGYQPPCPPPGAATHHYIFELYALDQKLDLTAGATRADLLKAMDGHVIGKATYIGVFAR